MNENMTLEKKLKTILDFNESIRFAGLLLSDGTLESFIQKPGLVTLLDKDESKKSYLHAVLRATNYKAMDSKLGKSIWTITLRQKIKWLTVYLNIGMIILSTEINSDHNKILKNVFKVFDI